jgi:hypothetical protein
VWTASPRYCASYALASRDQIGRGGGARRHAQSAYFFALRGEPERARTVARHYRRRRALGAPGAVGCIRGCSAGRPAGSAEFGDGPNTSGRPGLGYKLQAKQGGTKPNA